MISGTFGIACYNDAPLSPGSPHLRIHSESRPASSQKGGLSHLPLFWRFQIIGWLAFAVFTLPLKASAFGSVEYAVVVVLLREPLGLLLTSGFRLVYRRMDIRAHPPAQLAVCVLVFSFLAGGIDMLAFQSFSSDIQADPNSQNAVGMWCFRTMLYCVWSILYFWIRDHQRNTRRLLRLAHAETAARNAELLMLRAQVSPHFLFNSLNTILAGLDRQPATLAPTVQGLADYFRYSLTSRHDTLVTLGEEFDAMMNYLMVEKARFRDSLVIESHLDPAARSILVPGIFLQPLVENAIKYGYQTSAAPLRIWIRVETGEGESVRIEVRNTGEWVEPRPSDGSRGNGLSILRRRLELLYGAGQRITITTVPVESQVSVRIEIPPNPLSVRCPP